MPAGRERLFPDIQQRHKAPGKNPDIPRISPTTSTPLDAEDGSVFTRGVDLKEDDAAILSQSERLGIPWQAVLLDEILAERALQRGLGDPVVEWPLSCAFHFLPNTFLHSWRVRDRIDRLSWEATAERCEDAARQLRRMYLHLAGKRCPGAPVSFLDASHYWVAYRRVLELQRIVRRAQRGRGTRPERIAALVGAARCAPADAEWALDRALSRDRTHALDEAMRRAREEGFELPHGRSEPRAFLRMKQFLRRRGFLPARRGRPPAAANSTQESDESPFMDLYSHREDGELTSRE